MLQKGNKIDNNAIKILYNKLKKFSIEKSVSIINEN